MPVFTFVTDESLYAEMVDSFERAGFTSDRACFEQLRNDPVSGVPEPYSTLSHLVARRKEPFFILCHQDVRADRGDSFDTLVWALKELDRLEPRWAAAGNAGGTSSLRLIRHVSDPHGTDTAEKSPIEVETLDENFLVVRTGTGARCSPGLSGFHFYGTDFCLNAKAVGRTSHVIDFRLSHLSGGTKSLAYEQSREALVRHWSRGDWARYVRSTTEVLFFSRSGLLRRTAGSEVVRRVFKNRRSLGWLAGLLFRARPRSSRQADGRNPA